MNPYKAPQSVEEEQSPSAESVKKTFTCNRCGSQNTKIDEPFTYRPSIVAFLIFGWLYLLARTAFCKKSIICNDCGERRFYKSIGSWIAMATLILLIILILTSSE